jgi:hypothetical protein
MPCIKQWTKFHLYTEMIGQLELQIVPGLGREANGIVGMTKVALQLTHLV